VLRERRQRSDALDADRLVRTTITTPTTRITQRDQCLYLGFLWSLPRARARPP
jgi:hypothetical protein